MCCGTCGGLRVADLLDDQMSRVALPTRRMAAAMLNFQPGMKLGCAIGALAIGRGDGAICLEMESMMRCSKPVSGVERFCEPRASSCSMRASVSGSRWLRLWSFMIESHWVHLGGGGS